METGEPTDFSWCTDTDMAQWSAKPEVLDELARHHKTMVRYYVAWNRSAPPTALAVLAVDAYAGTRLQVACRKDAPIEALIVLAQDKDRAVREGVARNPSTPPMVKLYLQSGQYGGMTLKEFLEAANGTN